MTYSFRNRLKLHEGYRLDAEVPEITLAHSIDKGLVILWPVLREPGTHGGGFILAVEITKRGAIVSQADELVLEGSGYPDLDTAQTEGRKWRQYLIAALAREGKGADLGPDDQVTPAMEKIYGEDPPEFLGEIGIGVGHRVISDERRLLAFRTEPIPKFLNFAVGTPTVMLSGWLERFEQRTKDIREQHHRPWNKQESLAYRLVHLALGDSNPETRHIQLVTAIEVLFDDQNRPKLELEALDNLLAMVEGWSDSRCAAETKKRIIDILNADREESITQAGADQVTARLDGKYFDKDPDRFFKYVYDLRSRLVHRENKKRGKKRPDTDILRNVHSELLRFVLDLLDAYCSDSCR
ncbi:hypothetical protein [Mycobacteroides abscessus]|uniref:hypothetical protein n=1 Tax=Mycobacteroides abscessus TaxID=36809 RepID=UPI000C25A546|nr:hypothetical protein [Mycobacteroides abscessus]RIT97468.1 hypothetical protein D2F00_17115 [Mycobacteroides abscessus]